MKSALISFQFIEEIKWTRRLEQFSNDHLKPDRIFVNCCCFHSLMKKKKLSRKAAPSENVFNQLSFLLFIVYPTTRHKEVTERRERKFTCSSRLLINSIELKSFLMSSIICYDLDFIFSPPRLLIPFAKIFKTRTILRKEFYKKRDCKKVFFFFIEWRSRREEIKDS